MTLTLATAIAAALLFAVLAAVTQAAAGATALIPTGRIYRLVENDRPNARQLEELVSIRSQLRAVSSMLVGLSYAASSVSAFAMLSTWAPGIPAWLSAGVGGTLGTLLTYSLVQALPRTFAVANPERVGLAAAPFSLGITRFVSPLVRILGVPWKWSVGLVSEDEVPSPWSTGDEYFASSASDEDSARDEAEEALLEAVSDFGEKVVRELMVPRTDMVALEDTDSVSEAVAKIRATGYSRLPVYHDTIDDVRGILYAKDLLTAVERGGDVQIARIARTPLFVPETKPADQLLAELQAARTHIAIVADEYGGTAGLVTIEDVLEEIVGEIFDEYDLEVPMIEDLGDGRIRVDARLSVDDLNEYFGTAIELESADTVGGLFAALAGRIPARGESVEIEGLRLVADDLEGTRILHVTVEPAAPSAEEGTNDA